MLACAILLATSAAPKVLVTFADMQDATALGLPASFNTTLEFDWNSYDCAHVATNTGELVCDRTRMACMTINHTATTPSPTPVPIRIV